MPETKRPRRSQEKDELFLSGLVYFIREGLNRMGGFCGWGQFILSQERKIVCLEANLNMVMCIQQSILKL